ncbi:cell division protein FtsQ/DivIB [Halobacillus halophilus]|uniref:cell division protein FtsQ/DivIB n=1 Tax=Halobacillus halophilus TaxID=1570 RepID=UPI001CD3890D|nr:cell division protein FtsQ/DivIB [Halobacillus halophilus]MCA1013002.1 FtsQ-type POTRA domain-containing protein [Halobacillus halophilus]
MEERKVVSIEDRIPKLKQTRRKKANRRLILYLMILFLLIAIVIYLQSPLSNVGNIEVQGERHVTADEIKELANITTETNYWKVDTDSIKNNVESHKEIKSVNVNRDFPNTVQIQVEEAERIGYVQTNGEFSAILENGTKLETSSSLPGGDAPILAGFSKQTYLEEMSKELKELPQSVTNLISEIHWEPKEDNPYQIRLYMNDGFQVFASIRNFSNKMTIYPSIVAQLEEDAEGIIHIDVGAYFEEYASTGEEGDTEGEVQAENQEQVEDPISEFEANNIPDPESETDSTPQENTELTPQLETNEDSEPGMEGNPASDQGAGQSGSAEDSDESVSEDDSGSEESEQ